MKKITIIGFRANELGWLLVNLDDLASVEEIHFKTNHIAPATIEISFLYPEEVTKEILHTAIDEMEIGPNSPYIIAWEGDHIDWNGEIKGLHRWNKEAKK